MATNKKKTITKSAEPKDTNLEDSLLDTELQEGAVDDTAPEGDDEETGGGNASGEGSEVQGDTAGDGTEGGEQEEPTVLVAKLKILYQSHFYEPGEKLPRDDVEMEKAWLEAGSAELKTASEIAQKEKAAKAESVSALAGLSGITDGGEKDMEGNDLIGRVPKTVQRKK